MSIKQKIGGAIATGALLASVFAPAAFAANDILISGNGTNSTNNAAVIKVSKSKVKQKNITAVGTGVTSVSNTGVNRTNNNTGGSQSITTGNTTTTTNVDVAGGTNTNTGGNCCCDGQETTNTIEISGNGSNSDNNALIVDVCKHKVRQKNVTVVETSVLAVSNTGGNTANGNTGPGANDIDTGNTTTTTTVNVTGSSNSN